MASVTEPQRDLTEDEVTALVNEALGKNPPKKVQA
jgi:hypothetical protein